MKNENNTIIEFTLIFNRYKEKIYNYSIKMISNKMAAEDVVQNVFLKLFENFEIIRNKEAVNYWLFKTARNEIYAYFRRKKSHVDQFNVENTDKLTLASDYNLNEVLELKETKKLIMKELNSMAPEQREVYLLKEYGHLSYQEISEVMEIDEDLVKSRLYKARQKLIKRIAKLII